MRKFFQGACASGLAAVFAVTLGGAAAPAAAAESAVELPEQHWHFDGIFGTFDRAQLQRGLQVYKEVCSACHSLELISYRNLAEIGYNEEQIKAFASEATVTDGPDDEGEMFERSGLPSDRFPSPFPNEQAAAAGNGGAAPPDLSLIAKARAGGPDYIHALLVGYEDPPAGVELTDGQYYNKYFPGHRLAMPPPLFDDGVEYADGTEATVDQMAADFSAFAMWAAEPNLEERKRTGIKVILFLIVLTALLYALKRRVWSDVKH